MEFAGQEKLRLSCSRSNWSLQEQGPSVFGRHADRQQGVRRTYLAGQGGLVSRLILGIGGVIIWPTFLRCRFNPKP